jgi:hypothetical protein
MRNQAVGFVYARIEIDVFELEKRLTTAHFPG